MPALEHNVVEGGSTTLRSRHPVTVLHLIVIVVTTPMMKIMLILGYVVMMLILYLVQDFSIGHARIRNSPKGDQLCQKDPKAPHV